MMASFLNLQKEIYIYIYIIGMGPLNAWNLGGCFTCDGFLVDVFLWIDIYIYIIYNIYVCVRSGYVKFHRWEWAGITFPYIFIC